MPPLDPAYQSERAAVGRGLRDMIQDTGRERGQIQRDTNVAQRDLQIGRRRGLRDIKLNLTRGIKDIGLQRQDVKQEAARGREDFGTRLNNLIADYQTLGREQAQAGNAAGLTGGSYSQAAAAARSANLARERQPIDTGLERLEEDTETALGRLGISAGRLRRDSSLGRRDLKQDVRRDQRQLGREERRSLRDILLERQRGRREAEIQRADLLAQARYQANLNQRAGLL